ncbi:MAG: DUF4982 domain-containing protein [Armatimonadetes bacterium]|nr:DUF4982 domain-containing protein [Armatimonadota bacterium]
MSIAHLVLCACLFCIASAAIAEKTNIDSGWRFALGHAGDPEKDFSFSPGSFSAFAKAGTDAGPISTGFSDSSWRVVDLPHDWVVELPFDETSDMMHGYKPVGRKFPQNSVGWYRKALIIPESDKGKRIRITFDGVFRDSKVWINGHWVGQNASGYVGKTYDLTDYVRFGQKNVIAVRVDASFMEGWFYEGAGIYRHVWLEKSPQVCFEQDGVYFDARVEPNPIVRTMAEVRNYTDTPVERELSVEIVAPDGKRFAAKSPPVTIPARGQETLVVECAVAHPLLWSPEQPNLYQATAKIEGDFYSHPIGFRTIRFDNDKGFFLNGKHYLIQGTCNHQDHAGVGAAVPNSVNEWRIKRLQEFGCNFYRSSHNPPTPELLDACDRLGMMVLDETRQFGSVGEPADELRRFIRRDRNHPSVIYWSIGNEEWGTQNSDESARIAREMMKQIHELDTSRLITFGANNGGTLTGINSVVDVRGFNYVLDSVAKYHQDRPEQPLHGSELASTTTTRGEYAEDPKRGYCRAYDHGGVGWGTSAEGWWTFTLDHPYFAGGFVWTGFDYRGEPTPYDWPNINSHFGIVDTCGFFKDVAYYYQTWWTTKPTLHILPHWNWAGDEGKVKDVWVFSNHEEVELFLNENSLGRQKVQRAGHLEWKVPYAPGRLTAKGYRAGKVVQESIVETTAPASQLHLELAAKPGLDGVAIVNVAGLDSAGRLDPLASNLVTFKLEGEGQILGVGNGDPSCHEPDVLVGEIPYQNLDGWKLKRFEGSPMNRPEVQPDTEIAAWEPTKLDGNQFPKAGDQGVFALDFLVANPETWETLEVGSIDDEAWIYLNGKLLGQSTDWNVTHEYKIAGQLVQGRNRLAVVAVNHGGIGGFKGKSALGGRYTQPRPYQRSLFHGLAQVIVKVRPGSGPVKLVATASGLKSSVETLK